MRKILSFVFAALVCVGAVGQELEQVFNMDELVAHKGFMLSQNNPNPFDGTTDIYLCVVDPTEVTIAVATVQGQLEASYTGSFESGIHQFRITLKAKGTHVIGAHQNGASTSVVMLCNTAGSANSIGYVGFVEEIDPELFAALLDEDNDEDFIGYSAFKAARQPSELRGDEEFRVALSLSPFTLNQFEDGYSFKVGDKTATTPAQLQQIYKDLGASEMYVRLATKRHKTYKPDGTLDNTTDGKPDENANAHTLDQVLQTCKIAKDLNMPINPEVMCAYIYMDMDGTQAPRFSEDPKSDCGYPELFADPKFYKIMHGRKWEELSLDEICYVLEKYGEFVGTEILNTGCTVRNWNLGNEANFGFAGIGIGTPNSFDKALANAGAMKRYMSSLFSVWWLKKHVWKYEAQTLASVKKGILNAYAKLGKDASNVKFSTHIATVVSTPRASASFFSYMAENGYKMETAGISYYPSAPAMSFNKKKLLTKTVTRINKKCDVPVFIGEFSYPSQNMVGPFAGWNSQLGDYEKTQKGQHDIYADVVAWGKAHGMSGIRYWAPDYEGEWYPMSMFEFKDKVGTAKTILTDHKNIVK